MRAVIAIVIVAALIFLAYTYFFSLSEEEKKVKALANEFDEAVGDFLRAGRITAETGLATVSDSHDAVLIIKKVERELQTLKPQLKEESAQKKALKLEAKIKEFVRKNEIELF